MRGGRAWEAVLEHWHQGYRRDRLAWVAKAEPPVKMLSRKDGAGRFTACFERMGPPDFVGILGPDGRGVVFDAKDCTRARWPFSDLPAHQARDLEAAHDRGAVTFVALRLQGHAWVLPWPAVRDLYWRWTDHGGEPASLAVADLERLALPMGDAGWLPLVRAA